MGSGQWTAGSKRRDKAVNCCACLLRQKTCPSAWPICAVRVRIGVCVRMRLMIPSMVSECGPWTGDRGMQPEAGCLRAVSRTRLRRARGGRATPHPGDQLEPPPAGRPEPPIALAPHPAVPCLTARPHAPASGSSRGAVEVQVRFVLAKRLLWIKSRSGRGASSVRSGHLCHCCSSRHSPP